MKKQFCRYFLLLGSFFLLIGMADGKAPVVITDMGDQAMPFNVYNCKSGTLQPDHSIKLMCSSKAGKMGSIPISWPNNASAITIKETPESQTNRYSCRYRTLKLNRSFPCKGSLVTNDSYVKIAVPYSRYSIDANDWGLINATTGAFITHIRRSKSSTLRSTPLILTSTGPLSVRLVEIHDGKILVDTKPELIFPENAWYPKKGKEFITTTYTAKTNSSGDDGYFLYSNISMSQGRIAAPTIPANIKQYYK